MTVCHWLLRICFQNSTEHQSVNLTRHITLHVVSWRNLTDILEECLEEMERSNYTFFGSTAVCLWVNGYHSKLNAAVIG